MNGWLNAKDIETVLFPMGIRYYNYKGRSKQPLKDVRKDIFLCLSNPVGDTIDLLEIEERFNFNPRGRRMFEGIIQQQKIEVE